MCYFFFKQKTAYEMRISDWSSDVCSSDLARALAARKEVGQHRNRGGRQRRFAAADAATAQHHLPIGPGERAQSGPETPRGNAPGDQALARTVVGAPRPRPAGDRVECGKGAPLQENENRKSTRPNPSPQYAHLMP